jgi:phosphoribosylformylglycinamidine cyclo-ligase
MPGFYPEEEYDLAGFAVGVCDRKKMITGQSIRPGDVLVGIASSGVHSNGYSLVRRVFSMDKENLSTYREELGETLGEALLRPTKIYVKALRSVREAGIEIKGCSHITGGGFYENIPRMLPDGVKAVIRKDSYPVPAIFRMLQEEGEIAEHVMYNTFNMGIGMVMALDSADAEQAVKVLREAGEQAFVIGSVEAGERKAEIIG